MSIFLPGGWRGLGRQERHHGGVAVLIAACAARTESAEIDPTDRAPGSGQLPTRDHFTRVQYRSRVAEAKLLELRNAETEGHLVSRASSSEPTSSARSTRRWIGYCGTSPAAALNDFAVRRRWRAPCACCGSLSARPCSPHSTPPLAPLRRMARSSDDDHGDTMITTTPDETMRPRARAVRTPDPSRGTRPVWRRPQHVPARATTRSQG